jgi:predicted peroxiredoxin
MAQEARELICMITSGSDHELSSVGFTIANGGITAGLKVFIFLSSSGVDLVRKRAADTTQVNPLEPLAKLINDFMARGGTIWACTPSPGGFAAHFDFVVDVRWRSASTSTRQARK